MKSRIICSISSITVLLASASCYCQQKTAAFVVPFIKFRDEELLKPLAVLRSEGIAVDLFSSRTGTAKGMLGHEIMIEKTLGDLDVAAYDAVVFIGGAGAQDLFDNEQALEIARQAYRQGKVLGAICIAPFILGNAGVLEGKRATCWLSEGTNLQKTGAIFTGNDVEIDGNLVTASGPAAAEVFAQELLKQLK